MVIASIAILTALLLPTLSKAKERVLNIFCLNNLKQMAVSEMLYMTDNGAPFAYLGAGTVLAKGPVAAGGAGSGQTGTAKSRHCPKCGHSAGCEPGGIAGSGR